jgi:hypothetical protein
MQCYRLNMGNGNPVIEALRAALESKRQEIEQLEAAIRKYEAEEANAHRNKPKRFRKSTGLRPDSIPSLVQATLNAGSGPMSAAELSEALKANGRDVDSSTLAASISRYVGRIFRRNEEGKYQLVR